MSNPMPNNDKELDELITQFQVEIEDATNRQVMVRYASYYRKKLKAKLLAWRDTEVAKAKIEGMQAAKSRVLRRTEVPAGAKNPTRDYVVVLGEEIAGFIDDDIAQLKQQSEVRGEK